MKLAGRMRIRLSWALLLSQACVAAASADTLWESRPYEVAIGVEASHSGLTPPQRERLSAEVIERIRNRLVGFWRVRVASVSGEDRESETASLDKQITFLVEADGGGYRIKAVEKDLTLDDVGVPIETRAATAADLPERVYAAAISAFRPVAEFQRDPEVANRVTLVYRAQAIAPDSEVAMARAGELMLPFRRRLGRDGAPIDVSLVPWTYLVAGSPREDAAAAGAEVISHSRRPFGARPSGRLEMLAIAAPVDPDRRTVLRLHAINDDAAPLPGYEVSLGRPGDVTLTPLGYTDDAGRVLLPAEQGVWMAHVRCGSLVVASVPVAPGVVDEIAIPLVDERSRLRAELEVTSLREELIDTVARRKLLAERIRRLTDNEQVDTAKKLLDQFDGLPGKTDFTRRLQTAQRAAKASHPIAKARIDQLFEKTFAVLNSALDPRESRELAIAIDRARQDAEVRDPAPSDQQPPQEG